MRAKTTGDQMNRQTALGVACALAILFLPAVASAKKTKFMKCGKPLPLQLKLVTVSRISSGWRCGRFIRVYAIDVCQNTDRSQCNAADASAWFPFTDLQSRLGLATVTPIEKCKATTDDPKSACPGITGRAKKQHRTRKV